ncbi:hypothetical protein VHUM_02026 [Vanrija humicola]|uniref:Uncharacterized protein n=1 Tax=Vanrija humicola TaxID=5417 RepID=A0A7D8Z0K0_VANHU|nr:hypothetical protein VHUM_02026 [Vanrija humicola]
MGPTNPPGAILDTPINQNSYARLLSKATTATAANTPGLNAIDDFCLFAPPEPNSVIGDTEADVVAWCTKARNNARVIPDGTITAAHLVKTPMYWQIQGWGDFTKLNIRHGDEGGELDPHGADAVGNPIGGNVTSTANGGDASYEEWMSFMSYNEFCLRICTNEGQWTAGQMCEHQLDLMGCQWVMPGDYTDNSFTECDGDAAYPPGVYPQDDGSYSTFRQRYTGSYWENGELHYWTVGQAPASIPATWNCKTFSTIANGLDVPGAVAASSTATAESSSSASDSTTTASSSESTASASASDSASPSGASSSTTTTSASSPSSTASLPSSTGSPSASASTTSASTTTASDGPTASATASPTGTVSTTSKVCKTRRRRRL